MAGSAPLPARPFESQVLLVSTPSAAASAGARGTARSAARLCARRVRPATHSGARPARAAMVRWNAPGNQRCAARRSAAGPRARSA